MVLFYDAVPTGADAADAGDVGDVPGGVTDVRLRARPNERLTRDVDGLEEETTEGAWSPLRSKSFTYLRSSRLCKTMPVLEPSCGRTMTYHRPLPASF